MIEWTSVGAGALWIVGLAVVLAALSRSHWLASERGMPFRAVLGTPACLGACDLGLTMVSAGFCLSADLMWEHIVWAAFALLYAALSWAEWRRMRREADAAPAPCLTLKEGTQLSGWRELFASWMQRAELWWALVAIPFLLFPNRYSPWALAGIVFLWALRLPVTGRLTVRTPVDWPVLVLILLLPVALWASADVSMTGPSLYRLVAGITVFSAVVNWAGSSRRLVIATALLVLAGVGLTVVALFAATTWSGPKLFNAIPILSKLPMYGKLLISEDINANVLAGGLVIVWPVAASLLAARLRVRGLKGALVRLCLAGSLLWMTAVLVLTQSRGAFLGLGVAVILMGVLRWPVLRWVVLLSCVALLVMVWQGGAQQLQQLADVLSSTGTITSLAGRQEVWSRTIYMVQDFPYTGIGLGTFDRVQPLLYPFFLTTEEVHHAHNLFLQVAVDLGLPGLIAYLALLIGSVYAAWQAWQETRLLPETGFLSALALGLLGSQAAWVVHGLLDAGVWASKLAFVPWFIMGLAITTKAGGWPKERIGENQQA